MPCHNEEENIERTHREIKRVLSSLSAYDYEIVFVDNGSTDRTAELMKSIAATDPQVTAVMLSRNFGPESSGLAGMQYARGDAVIAIAADLQDPPDLIPEFIKHWEAGYDLVLGQAVEADENQLMLKIRRLFYRIMNRISYVDCPVGVTGFGLIAARVNDAVVAMPEKNRFGRGLLAWAGFRRKLVPYHKARREFGRSSYNLFSYFKHAEQGLFSFTTLPLDIITYLGIALVALSVVASVVYAFWVLAFGNPIKGSATIFLGVMFFGGAQIFAVSIVGKYIGIIFEETKNRPHYIVREVVTQNPALARDNRFNHDPNLVAKDR